MADTREKLAAYAHVAWSGWMSYLFSRCVERERFHEAAADPDDLVIPGQWVRRWQRQVNTTYAELSEPEKDSDRTEADKMLAIAAQGKSTMRQVLSRLDTAAARIQQARLTLRR